MRYISIDRDRYGGCYSGSSYTAWDGNIPDDVDAGDITCENFWKTNTQICGLDHIDNNHDNNTLENFQILCANCHSLKTKKARIKNEVHIRKHDLCKCREEKQIRSLMCKTCSNRMKISSKKPSKEMLSRDLENLKYFTKVGQKYRVSDITVKKWCVQYKLI